LLKAHIHKDIEPNKRKEWLNNWLSGRTTKV